MRTHDKQQAVGRARFIAIIMATALSTVAAPTCKADGATAPSPGDEVARSGVAVSGYVDVSYQWLGGSGQFSTGSPDRVFDGQQDGAALHQIALSIALQPKDGFGAVLNLVAGQDADVFAPYDLNPGARSKFDFPQAYLRYATGRLTVIAGRYVTLAGYETLDPRTDTNFSRSVLYGFAIPFAHTGLRATVVVSDAVTLNLGVVNGWDDLKDTNSAKTVEFGVTYAPTHAASLTVDGYIGRERVGGLTSTGPEGQRRLLDVIGSWAITDALTVVLNYDYGRQDHGAIDGQVARWQGLAGYVNYLFSGHWRASLRAEALEDPDGYRSSVQQRWAETTATLAWMPIRTVELRLEGRQDQSSRAAFVTRPAPQESPGKPADLARRQGSVAFEGLYKF